MNGMEFSQYELDNMDRGTLRSKEYGHIIDKYKSIEEAIQHWHEFRTRSNTRYERTVSEEDLIVELKNIKKLIGNVENYEEIKLYEMDNEEKINFLNFDERKLILLVDKILKSFDIKMPTTHLKGLLGINVALLAKDEYAIKRKFLYEKEQVDGYVF